MTTNAPKIHALLPYFGGKRAMGTQIQRLLRYRANYLDVFAGSCAALFAREPRGVEIVNDLYGHVTNLCIVLQSPRWAELAERFERTVMCEGIAAECTRILEHDLAGGACAATIGGVTGDHVEAAYRLLVASWQGRSGFAGTGDDPGFAVRFTATGGDPSKRVRSVAESLPRWHERLRCVTVTRRDALDVLASADDSEAWGIYADPPYIDQGERYAVNPGPPLFAMGWHEGLAAALNRFERARVVVSYYPHPELDRLYPAEKWKRVEVEVNKATSNPTKRGGVGARATELLLVNGVEARV